MSINWNSSKNQVYQAGVALVDHLCFHIQSGGKIQVLTKPAVLILLKRPHQRALQ